MPLIISPDVLSLLRQSSGLLGDAGPGVAAEHIYEEFTQLPGGREFTYDLQTRIRSTANLIEFLIRAFSGTPYGVQGGRHGEDASSGLLERFRRAPAPGDRAPDAEFGAPGRRGRIHELLYGTEHVLLLFAGSADRNGGPSPLFKIARDVSERYGPHVRIHVVSRASTAARVNDSELVVADPQGEFHRSWHADAGHLYLIRPDQHIGYRAVPAHAARLCSYLDSVFTQTGDRT